MPGEGILYGAAHCVMWVPSTGMSSVWWQFLVSRGPVPGASAQNDDAQVNGSPWHQDAWWG